MGSLREMLSEIAISSKKYNKMRKGKGGILSAIYLHPREFRYYSTDFDRIRFHNIPFISIVRLACIRVSQKCCLNHRQIKKYTTFSVFSGFIYPYPVYRRNMLHAARPPNAPLRCRFTIDMLQLNKKRSREHSLVL